MVNTNNNNNTYPLNPPLSQNHSPLSILSLSILQPMMYFINVYDVLQFLGTLAPF
jgi:hypothetical protein